MVDESDASANEGDALAEERDVLAREGDALADHGGVSGDAVVVRASDDVDGLRRLGIVAGLDSSDRGYEQVLASWGAFVGAEMIGGIVLEQMSDMAVVNWLSVKPSWRRHGVASRLYAALEAEAEGREITELYATARAASFFRRHGFVEVEAGHRRDVLLATCPQCKQYGHTCTPLPVVKRID
ncbi:MAG: GNAT family N-acetyltransferase [Thermoleophilia bacterium]